MKKTLKRHRSGYALGFLLLLFGLFASLIILWKTWPLISSAENPVSTFWESLWMEKFGLFQGVELELIYIMVTGIGMLVSGAFVLTLSRQWFLLVEERALFRCPFCRRRWKTSSDKALVHCPHCRQLVHPNPVDR